VCRGRLIQYHYVYSGKVSLLGTERFPDDAFQAVSPGCVTTVFFANCQTEARCVAAVIAVKDSEHLVATAASLFKYPTKRVLVRYPACAPETLTGSGFGIGFCNGLTGLAALWRQLGPAFRTATLQNESTCFSCHS